MLYLNQLDGRFLIEVALSVDLNMDLIKRQIRP
jgi:hypothetical protein